MNQPSLFNCNQSRGGLSQTSHGCSYSSVECL